jgi:hypothetical protein
MKQISHGIELVALGQASLLKAQKVLTGCSVCSRSASRSFASVINETLGTAVPTEYLLCSPVECPVCSSAISETTFVSIGFKRDLPIEETDVVFVDERTLSEAELFISACEHCEPDRAEISFAHVLDALTCCDPTVTEYVICRLAKCRSCESAVTEETLIVTD